eukprot:COSAG03_NODE_12406_length_549_cov_0.533333_2_plen_66_part_01
MAARPPVRRKWPTAGAGVRSAAIAATVVALTGTAAQPSFLEGLCQLPAAREGLEVLCCGGMRCIEN